MEIVTSPFYREIYSCTFKIERRCVIIHEAEQIHEIIQNHNAVGSTPTSLPNLHRFLDVRDQTPTWKIENINPRNILYNDKTKVKFDLLKRNIPYYSLMQVFQPFVKQLLTESEENETFGR